MKSQDYFCSDECTYVNHCTFGYKEFAYGATGTQIPDRRFCPKCGALGSYGLKCKLNRCQTCDFEFCFFCLKEKGGNGLSVQYVGDDLSREGSNIG